MTDEPRPSAITAYGDGGFRISGLRYEGSVLVMDYDVLAWQVGDHSEITVDSLEPLWSQATVELILIGCGATLDIHPNQIVHRLEKLKTSGVSVEIMDTGAACRTYGVLRSEGRKVVAGLIAID